MMRMRRTVALSWVLLLSLLTGCMTTGQGPTTASRPQGSPQSVPVSDAPAQNANGLTLAGPAAEDYRLSPLDVIEVTVFEVPELTKTVQVNAGGMISLPLIGRVTAGGRTVSELEREIERRLAEEYLRSPQASVFVKEYTSQRITVEGAVNSPGIFPISGRTTLLQAIAMAKGPDRTADESGVIIFRTSGDTKTAAVFDIGPIRTGQAPDPVLVGGDVIVVDQSAARTAWRDIRESIGVLGFFRPAIF
jgi:polysaccharide biosynthesis/export protein